MAYSAERIFVKFFGIFVVKCVTGGERGFDNRFSLSSRRMATISPLIRNQRQS